VIDFSILPSVDSILREKAASEAEVIFGHSATIDAIRATLADERILLKSGHIARSGETLAMIALERLRSDAIPSLRPVFNLTGTILHTNFGRAQLPEAAIIAAMNAMRNAVSLEYDLEIGDRGERDDHLRALICELTGAEDATLVNNNAAAVLLVLNTLSGNGKSSVISLRALICELTGAEDATLVNNNAAAVLLVLNTLSGNGKSSIISRGELIEIGGAFRMPDIMESAGCRLVEVGTTNRTHLKDYEKAIRQIAPI
jgi:Selenocysteine synthase [seryl-tRNASer selenium transferase]